MHGAVLAHGGHQPSPIKPAMLHYKLQLAVAKIRADGLACTVLGGWLPTISSGNGTI